MDFRTIRQSEAAECGLACLAIASGALGAEIDLTALRRRYPVSSRGLNLEEMIRIAAALDMTTRAVRCEVEELRELRTPAILHWGLNHFVVLLKVTRKGIQVQDPARGVRVPDWKEVDRKFTGVALELTRSPAFRRRKEKSALNLTSLLSITPEIRSAFIHTLVLSVLLQAYVIGSPFYIQLAIDEAALKGDQGLLGLLAIGFALFGVFNVGAGALRAVAMQKMSALMGWDMTGRLFHHMIRLPLPWFQSRRLADAHSRFESIEPVRGLFASGLVGSVIDGVMAIATLVMMLLFAWQLAIVALVSLAAYVILRQVAITTTIRLAGDSLVASIDEQGKRLETLRAIQTIKVMGAEAQREGEWANRYAETLKTNQNSALAQIGFSSLQSLLDTLSNVAVIYLGAREVMSGSITVGLLFAFLSYKAQFTARAQGLYETFVEWRMLDLHSDRIADIALNPVERGIDEALGGMPDMKGGVSATDLSFRYAPYQPMIFEGVSLRIEPGEFVAVTGPSGAGKSTFIKVLCGLYPPVAGKVAIDDIDIATWGPRTVRQNIGVVLQDDELISGSIAENVSFFAETIDMEWVWTCLEMAGIADDVRNMPMRTETFVGDMGSSLSGGQKQRVLLARAFYRRPKILILDEATSHLDVARERQINDAIKGLEVTRIVIAHRPETIAAADRVLELSGGRISEGSVGTTEAP